MSQSNPIIDILVFLISAYIFWQWVGDYRLASAGTPSKHPWPGATKTSAWITLAAILGAIALLIIETMGEYRLGIVESQSTLPVSFLALMIAAAFTEELIFRGYLVVSRKGPSFLWLSAIGFSVLFSLLHPQLWNCENNHFELTLTLKGGFSTAMLFFNSLWLYWARFNTWNPTHSLSPCIAAHFIKNIGVFIIKFEQGYISGFGG